MSKKVKGTGKDTRKARRLSVTISVNSLLQGDVDLVKKLVPGHWRLKSTDKHPITRATVLDYEVILRD